MAKTLLLTEEPIETTKKPKAKVATDPTVLRMPKSVEKYAETVRKLYRQESHDAPFKLGDALNEMADALEKELDGKKATNNMIAALLKIKLSPQRISSLRLTAEWFPSGTRKSEYPFKEYEKYRKVEQKKPEKDQRKGKELVAAMDAKELSDEKPKVNPNKHTLMIRVTVDTTDPNNLKFDPQISADGKAVGELEDWMLAAAEQAKAAIDLKTKSV